MVLSTTAPAPAVDETPWLGRGETTALIQRRLMPILIGAYVVSFLDRTNIGLAKGVLQADLGLSDAAFGLGAGLFFLTYALSEVPSNLIMHRVGARVWITRIMVTWGLISAATALVQGPISFYVLRLLLGFAEAGLFPSVMLYLASWFGPEDRARASGLFLLGVCIANIVGGPVGGFLLEMNGLFGLRGWQWLFVVEAAPAIVLAFVVWRSLPDRPRDAAWLSPDQAAGVERQIRDSQPSAEHASTVRALLTGQGLITVAIYFCHQISIYTVTFFLPGIISGWGRLSAPVVGSLAALPWIAAALGAVLMLRSSLTARSSRVFMVTGLLVMAMGLSIAAVGSPIVALLGFCLSASVFFVVQAILFTYPASRLSGVQLAAGLAFVNSCGLLGGFVGPTAMGVIQQQTGKSTDGLFAMAALLVVAAGLACLLRQGTAKLGQT